MGLFFPEDSHEDDFPGRKVGFPRYREVLEGNVKDFFLVGLLTLAFHLPFGAGMAYAILSSSALAALAAGVVGGLIAAPAYAALVDLILRRLRDDLSDWWLMWKQSMRQNTRAALLPGLVQYTFLAVLIYAGALFLWGVGEATLGTLLLMALSALLMLAVLGLWWPQVVLFEQKPLIQLKNCLLFLLLHLPPALGAGAIKLLWWLVMFLFLPWTGLVMPFLGLWYVLYLTLFILYPTLDEAFRIEEQLAEKYRTGR